ncbi:ty3-gypsy retroelement polyprotein [Tanacetum coccineum]
MMCAPVLKLPNLDEEFMVETDASGEGIGEVLQQQSHPIAYLSKTLSPKHQVLSIYEKEFLAVLQALEKWRGYLLDRHFKIKSYHFSLKYLLDQRISNPIQMKWLPKLMGFDYEIQFKRWTENVAADATDNEIQALIKKLETDPASAKHYTWIDGLLMRKGKLCVGSDTSLQHDLIEYFHGGTLCGHSGVRVTTHRICTLLYWKKISRHIKQFIRECSLCHRNKHDLVAYPRLLQPLPILERVWSGISIDFIEGLPMSKGKSVIMVVVDRLSKYSHLIPLAHPFTVVQVAQAFLDNIYKLHGLPKVIVVARISKVAYRLALPVEAQIHPVFHLSQVTKRMPLGSCLRIWSQDFHSFHGILEDKNHLKKEALLGFNMELRNKNKNNVIEQAFLKLKEAMMCAPVLKLPDLDEEFVVETDASGEGIGEVLQQQSHPIAYLSKTLSPKHQVLSIYEKEFLAVLQALEKWRGYLLDRHFKVKSYHFSLKYLLDQRISNPIQMKWLPKLMGFDYEIQFKRWTENATDNEIQALIKKLETDPASAKHYTWIDGLLMRKGKLCVGSDTSLQHDLIEYFHGGTLCGHSGVRVTTHRICTLLYWKKMSRHIKQFIRECSLCHRNKHDLVAYPRLLQPLPILERVWSGISIDFIEGLPMSKGKSVIMVVVDRLSKYSHLIPLAHPFTVVQVAQAFLDNIYKLHRLPKVIIDGQTNMVNRCLECYLRCMTGEKPKEWMHWISLAEYCKVAYRLALPVEAQIHPVFHVSQGDKEDATWELLEDMESRFP